MRHRQAEFACHPVRDQRPVTSLGIALDNWLSLLALSTPPGDPDWGRQSAEEWTKLLATLKSAGELPGDDKPAATFFTNDFVPK